MVSAEAPGGKAAVVVSQQIRPYLEAVEGFREEAAAFVKIKISEFNLEKYKKKGLTALSTDFAKGGFDLFVAIGPEAAHFVWTDPAGKNGLRLYAMVLDPQGVIGDNPDYCGITLNIEPEIQIKIISCAMPQAGRIGILYDPLNNTDFVNQAKHAAVKFGTSVIPLPVSSKKDILSILEQSSRKIDALLFIPDSTVISESLVRYIIRKAISQRVPVVGYNRFFYECGATLAFVLDYRAIGRNTANMATQVLSGKRCEKQPPVFQTWLNLRIAKLLGVDLKIKSCKEVIAGP